MTEGDIIIGAQHCHVVFIPKCRRKTLYKQVRRCLGEVLRRLAERKEGRIDEGHLIADSAHMITSIPSGTLYRMCN